MSVLLDRFTTFETVQVQSLAGIDGQGLPAYSVAQPISARTTREDTVVKLPNGSEVNAVITIWIPSDQAPMPELQWRVTIASGFVGIVVERADAVRFSNAVDHVRVRLRQE